jgi:hypothetical protein
MKSTIDTSYTTAQQDLFASGLAAQIGPAAYTLWNAIKQHADNATGESDPGMRRLAQMTGMGLGTVSDSVKILERNRLLRVLEKGKGKAGTRYIARERMDIKVGKTVICTIVIDYIPWHIGKRIQEIGEAVNKEGRVDPDALAECEIIPGPDFRWDPEKGLLHAAMKQTNLRPEPEEPIDEDTAHPAVRRLMDTRRRISGSQS